MRYSKRFPELEMQRLITDVRVYYACVDLLHGVHLNSANLINICTENLNIEDVI